MKSKRAKEQLEFNLQHYKEVGEELSTISTIRCNVETIAELAEQDAEQRALKSFCVACTHYVDFSLCERKTCPELEEFRQLIGGRAMSECEYCNKMSHETRIPSNMHNFKFAYININDHIPSLILDGKDCKAYVLHINFCHICGRKINPASRTISGK